MQCVVHVKQRSLRAQHKFILFFTFFITHFIFSNHFFHADPDNSFLPSSPAYEQDHHLQEHESRLVGGSSGKRRVAIDSDDSDDGEHQVKRPHQELDDDDIGDPFAEPLKDPLENQNQEDPDTSDTDKPQPGKGADDEDDPSISDFDKAMRMV